MGQSKGKSGLSSIAQAMPLTGSDKDIASAAISSADLKNPETVHRLAGEVFKQPVGNYGVRKPVNTYTQQGAYGVEIPE